MKLNLTAIGLTLAAGGALLAPDTSLAQQVQKINSERSSSGSTSNKINSTRGSARVSKTRQCKTDTVTDAQIAQWVSADTPTRNNENVRYFAIPVDILNDTDKTKADLARIALIKALNMTSIRNTDVKSCDDISDGHGAVYACDLSLFWGTDVQKNWQAVQSSRARSPFSPAPAISARALGTTGQGPFPVDQVVYNMVYGNVYNELINMERSEPNQRRKDGIINQPEAWLCVTEAIVFGPRYISLWRGKDGLKYWTSADEFANRPNGQCQNITPRIRRQGTGQITHWGTQASEAWMEMPNGFLKFFIWGNAAQERSKAEKVFVVDPGNTRTRDLINGRSCITCHINGVHAPRNDNAQYGGVWTPQETLNTLYSETRTRWQGAMRKVVESVSCGTSEWNEATIVGVGKEPISTLIERIEVGGRSNGNQQRNNGLNQGGFGGGW